MRIANTHGAGTALAAIGFIRCVERHFETGQRCLLGAAHGSAADAYAAHQGESVTWLTHNMRMDPS